MKLLLLLMFDHKVNAKKVENKKAHFKQINVELEQTAN
jgi:type III secretory pathway lipoprotein EscJ